MVPRKGYGLGMEQYMAQVQILYPLDGYELHLKNGKAMLVDNKNVRNFCTGNLMEFTYNLEALPDIWNPVVSEWSKDDREKISSVLKIPVQDVDAIHKTAINHQNMPEG